LKLLLVSDFEDKEYLVNLKFLLKEHQVFVHQGCPQTVSEIVFKCKAQKVDAVITSNENFLRKIIPTKEKPKLSDYAGSIVDIGNQASGFLECLVISPLAHIHTVRHGRFLLERFLSKLTKLELWNDPLGKFGWTLGDNPTVLNNFYSLLDSAIFVASDIETSRATKFINCVGYTAVLDRNTARTIVVPVDSQFNLAYIRQVNAHPIPKVFQNGLYDNSYFIYGRAPVTNWYFDTQHLFHSWLSELPKALSFIVSYMLRKQPFWKDQAREGDLESYYEYNGRDCFGTASALIKLLEEMPDWAVQNYTDHEFPLTPACLSCALEGLKVDLVERERIRKEQQTKLDENIRSLGVMSNTPGFNPNSPKQVAQLLTLCQVKNVKSTKESELQKFKFYNPLAGRFIERILDAREQRKLLSTYVECELEGDRLLYSLSPGLTDTGRLASRAGFLWNGTQIQNQPPYAKSMYIADEGYDLAEADNEQSESRCTGYLAQDATLIAAVESDRDFHCTNASLFFGISYEEILAEHKSKKDSDNPNDTTRYLGKRVNHGATYNMKWAVLIDTMGLEKIFLAKKLLKLPSVWTARQVAEHLIKCYERAYPGIKGTYYADVVYRVLTHGLLVSPLGWTRKCFGNPKKNPRDLNAYVAHEPQNLSVGIINLGFRALFRKQIEWWPRFRLKAQIHDSILFQIRKDSHNLLPEISSILQRPIKVHGRVLEIPVSMKVTGQRWSATKS